MAVHSAYTLEEREKQSHEHLRAMAVVSAYAC